MQVLLRHDCFTGEYLATSHFVAPIGHFECPDSDGRKKSLLAASQIRCQKVTVRKAHLARKDIPSVELQQIARMNQGLPS
jgi:hypothetical protein